MLLIDILDLLALAVFLGAWMGYGWLTQRSPNAANALNGRMNAERARWLREALRRDIRMVDTAIFAGLQQGTGFFASALIFAIGGCFALLGSADQIAQVAADLPFYARLSRPLVELKLLGLVVIFAYGFFKFAWAYRLFNYGSILLGALPPREEIEDNPAAEIAVRKAIRLNQIGGSHFNAGLRSIFFAIAYLGWFLGPLVLLLTTAFVSAIVLRRQYHSDALEALSED